MRLLKKWRKKRKLRYIPLETQYGPLYKVLKNFYEDISLSIESSKRIRKIIPANRRQVIYKSHYYGRYDATYKVILFGDRGAERTKLTHKFLTNLFQSDSKVTLGIDFDVKNLEVDNKRIKLQIWDIFGEERFRFLLPTYIRGANGALFIYDDTNYSSLAHIDDWLIIIRKEVSRKNIIPIIVVGIVSESDKERQISTEEAIKIAESRGLDGFIECSVRTGENVEETFEELTRLMLANVELV